MGQVFDFVLAGIGVDEVGSATGVVEAMQQLASAVGVAAGNDLLLRLRRPSTDPTHSRSPRGRA